MNANIAATIADLLYEYNSVTIPRFGGITTYYQASYHDPVTGKITPPSNTIEFNRNLVVDDGLLIDKIAKQYNLSYADASRQVEEFVTSLKEQLANGETVTLDKVGRFYQYNDLVQFTSADQNYNTESFGLPTITAKAAIPKTEDKVKFTTPVVAVAEETSTSSPTEYGQYVQWALIVLGAIALAIAAYTIWSNLSSKTPTEDIVEAPVPINEAAQTFEEEDNSSDVDTIVAAPVPTAAAEASIPRPVNTEAATPTTNAIKIIVVGAFDNKENAERQVMSIQKAGYVPYRFTRNGRRCIGIQYAYNQESEFNKVLADVRTRFAKDAWVLTD